MSLRIYGDTVSLADVALVAYTRWTEQGGFDLALYPAVQAWIARVEAALNIATEGSCRRSQR